MESLKLHALTEQISKKLDESVDNLDSLEKWKQEIMHLVDEIGTLKLASSIPTNETSNTSLDPTDWSSAKQLAHQVLDSSIEYIQHIRDKPVWKPIPDQVRSIIETQCVPENGQTLTSICHEVFEYIVPYNRGNIHPRFWGWVMGEGTFGGILAEIIMATININAGGCTHSAVLVERTIIQWMRQIFGFPQTSHGGIIVSGTSMASVISMAAARQKFMSNVRKDGMSNKSRLIVYVSTEGHMCIKKALELLGFGSNSLHIISVKENFSINTDELKTTIENDRKAGFIPFCIVGNAGTVNTGAFDDLLELSSIARTENMWFHVDGAFGALVILDPERRHLLNGVEQADSLAFDFHKWLHCPYDAGCVLVRNSTDLLSTFSVHQSYLAHTERGCAGDNPWYCDLGPELSRQFRALKIWFTLKEHGTVRLGQKIAENCQQAQYLASLLEPYEEFIHVIRPVSLNIVNFRCEPKELDQTNIACIDEFNNELLSDIQISGNAVASTTHIHGKLYIRVCIVSHRSVLKDFDIFVNTVLQIYHARLENTETPTKSDS